MMSAAKATFLLTLLGTCVVVHVLTIPGDLARRGLWSLYTAATR